MVNKKDTNCCTYGDVSKKQHRSKNSLQERARLPGKQRAGVRTEWRALAAAPVFLARKLGWHFPYFKYDCDQTRGSQIRSHLRTADGWAWCTVYACLQVSSLNPAACTLLILIRFATRGDNIHHKKGENQTVIPGWAHSPGVKNSFSEAEDTQFV